jgi:hypothetical protein
MKTQHGTFALILALILASMAIVALVKNGEIKRANDKNKLNLQTQISSAFQKGYKQGKSENHALNQSYLDDAYNQGYINGSENMRKLYDKLKEGN